MIGAALARPDLPAKLTGAAVFAADLAAPGALHVKLLRSPVAHARITALDGSAALAVPGVVAVVTAEDLRDLDATWGHYVRDRPILADGVVRFAGEIVAAVAAETEAAAERGVAAIAVDYAELPALLDVRHAVAPGAAAVHEGPPRPGYACPPGAAFSAGNAFYHYLVDHERAPGVDPADAVVVEGEYAFPAVYQYAMEPHTTIAAVGRLTRSTSDLVPAPVPGARRARRSLRLPVGSGARSWCRTWAAGSAASRTPRWSRSRSRWPARRGARCGSPTASTRRWSPPAATA